jgi:hypothetical protein
LHLFKGRIGEEKMKMESINKKIFVSNGKVAAAVISASIGLVLMGIFTYERGPLLGFLQIWKPIAAVGGIWLYGYLAWIISWMILYKALGKKEKIANMKVWLVVFFASLAVSTVLMLASLDWPPLS